MNKGEEKNGVGLVLRIFGWIIIIGGFFSGYALAKPSLYLSGYYGYDVFLWPIAIGVWFGSAFSGTMAIGLAEIIDQIKTISDSLKVGSTNMSEFNESDIHIKLANERIYADAEQLMTSSISKEQLIRVKEILVPISGYKDVNDILVSIDNKIELIDREVRRNEERSLELRKLEEERKKKQRMFWKKHSSMVFVSILILIFVTAGFFFLTYIKSVDMSIIETWSGKWMISSRSVQKDGFILNIKEEKVSLCVNSVCGLSRKVKFNDLSVDKISFKLNGEEHKLFLMSKDNASYLKDGLSYDVVRTKK